MAERRNSRLTAALWLGVVLLLGVPSLLVTTSAVRSLFAPLVGATTPQGTEILLLAAVFAVSLSVVATTAIEGVRQWLRGLHHLRAETAGRRIRHVAVAVPALALLVVLCAAGLAVVLEIYSQFDAYAFAAFAGLTVAFSLIVSRSVWSFLDGLRAAYDSELAR